jgi:hypothetical protein
VIKVNIHLFDGFTGLRACSNFVAPFTSLRQEVEKVQIKVEETPEALEVAEEESRCRRRCCEEAGR